MSIIIVQYRALKLPSLKTFRLIYSSPNRKPTDYYTQFLLWSNLLAK